MPETTYFILREATAAVLNDPASGWVHVDSCQATGAEHAVRIAAARADKGQESGRWVAVPARSWKPVAVTSETKTVLKIETPTT